MIGEIALSMAG